MLVPLCYYTSVGVDDVTGEVCDYYILHKRGKC